MTFRFPTRQSYLGRSRPPRSRPGCAAVSSGRINHKEHKGFRRTRTRFPKNDRQGASCLDPLAFPSKSFVFFVNFVVDSSS